MLLDGAPLPRDARQPLVRRRGKHRVGHASVKAQLAWLEDAAVPRALFTHCGSGVVKGDERMLGPRLRRWGREGGVEARFAFDGMKVRL